MLTARYIALFLNFILDIVFMNKRFFLFVREEIMSTSAGFVTTKKATIIDMVTCRMYFSTYHIANNTIEFEEEYFTNETLDDCRHFVVVNANTLVEIHNYAAILEFSKRIVQNTKGV